MIGTAASTVLSESGSTQSCVSSARAMFCCHVSLIAVRPSSTPAVSDMACEARTGGSVTIRSMSDEGSCSGVSYEPNDCTCARGHSCAESVRTRATAAWWKGRRALSSAVQRETKRSMSAWSAEYMASTGAMAAAAAACASTAAALESCAESIARCAPVSCGDSDGIGRSPGTPNPSAPIPPPALSGGSTPHRLETVVVSARSCASIRLQDAR
jgi:hypothetical protein